MILPRPRAVKAQLQLANLARTLPRIFIWNFNEQIPRGLPVIKMRAADIVHHELM